MNSTQTGRRHPMRFSLVAIAVVILASLVSVFGQGVNLRPGNYEMINEFTIPDMPKVPPVRGEHCITPEEIKKMSSNNIGDFNQMGLNCKTSDSKLTGSKVTFKMTCQDRTWEGEITFNSDSYTGVMRGRDKKNAVVTAKMTAKRIGECTKQ